VRDEYHALHAKPAENFAYRSIVSRALYGTKERPGPTDVAYEIGDGKPRELTLFAESHDQWHQAEQDHLKACHHCIEDRDAKLQLVFYRRSEMKQTDPGPTELIYAFHATASNLDLHVDGTIVNTLKIIRYATGPAMSSPWRHRRIERGD
jgi:hypothetical protein